MNVSSILRRKGTHVETARPETAVGDAAQRLSDHGIGSLVVLDEERKLLGVLSERDLVCALARHGSHAWHVPVGDLLGERPVTCRPEDTLQEVMSIMTRQRTRHLPVIAGEAVVGIISLGDVVKGQLEDLQIEVGVLRDFARARR